MLWKFFNTNFLFLEVLLGTAIHGGQENGTTEIVRSISKGGIVS